MTRTRRLILLGSLLAICLFALLWLLWPEHAQVNAPIGSQTGNSSDSITALSPSQDERTPTTVYAHNLKLRKGPTFRIYISWIRGVMLRTRPQVNPSFDAPDSFVFRIDKGVIRANLGDIGNFLNSAVPAAFSLHNIKTTGDGDQVHLTGTMRKLLLPLPVELVSTISPTPEGRVHLRITKINVLKMPIKALLGGLHVSVASVMGKTPLAGVTVNGNDLFFDTTRLLPPPHIRGQITGITLARPDLVLIYGNSNYDPERLARWHNFLRFTDGTLDFGKLTMRHCDLTLIDASDEPWFDLDLVNYQAQLVNGYSRITPAQGLEIYMPSLEGQPPKKPNQPITLDWLRNRNSSMPADVPKKRRR